MPTVWQRAGKTGSVVVAVGLLVAALVLVRSHAGAEQHPSSATDVPVISVQEATDHPIDDAHVSLAALPHGYVPSIELDEALRLAFEQLGPGADPTGAWVYLGTNRDETPVWVVTYQGVCGAPDGGVMGEGSGCSSDTLSVALDAASGAFIVAW